MSSVSQIASALQEVLNEQANELAKETTCIQRERQISGADFAQALIFGWLQEPQTTVEGLTQILQRRAVTMSGPGLSQRFTEASAHFMEAVLQELTSKQLATEAAPIGLLKRFSAVMVEDSSTVCLPEELAKVWRGCGGSYGASNAALKLFVRWDVLGARLYGPVITDARRSDQRSPLPLSALPDGSLEIADLGFWSTTRFAQIAARQQGRSKRRSFLSRWQPATALRRRNGSQIVLRGLLPQQVAGRREFGAILSKERLAVRVLIERVPRAVGDQRRKDRAAECPRSWSAGLPRGVVSGRLDHRDHQCACSFGQF
jgi:hypothetical protein